MTSPRSRANLTGAGARRLAEGGERVVVTGAGGWLGMASLELLHAMFGGEFHRRVVCYGASRRELRLRGGVNITQQPLAALAGLAPAPSLVLHLAYLTQEKAEVMSPEAYAAANRAISQAVAAALPKIGALGLFLASSGAVYLADDPAASVSMRLYGRLKLEDETRFAAWAGATGGRLAVARVFNLSGPYINKRSSYALASFIDDVLAGRPIVIRASRQVWRSYVAIAELMGVVIGALTDAPTGRVSFDTAGETALELGELAVAVSRALGREPDIRRPPLTGEAPDRYVGDGALYAELRSRFAVRRPGMADQIRATAAYMAGAFDSQGEGV